MESRLKLILEPESPVESFSAGHVELSITLCVSLKVDRSLELSHVLNGEITLEVMSPKNSLAYRKSHCQHSRKWFKELKGEA